ncbi:metalloendopeptidase [Biomphalaria glabrata]|uniref:Metalloendopeptidase n=2 Tax=Biomphalaria glabrata TaxID=6526 RepID=A0A9W2Z0Q8_BIOGL|nr:uncharacterized protein LOC106063484 isoform X1 [Biomphalaria glabrata]XP_055868535.1 uncharacterized protein LOC106063484 isoform X1 [Biomphalaria glabrata]
MFYQAATQVVTMVLWLTTTFVLTNTMFISELSAGNEDGDQMLLSKSQKPLAEHGLRQYEGPHGIPVSIDSLFTQITTGNSDDQGHSGSSECTQGSELSELDMCITPSQAAMFESFSGGSSHYANKRKRQASANGFSLWKNGVIPYVFNSTFPPQDRDAILGAMLEWEKSTCIRFRQATSQDVDVVVFRDGRRCSTNIGRIGREQVVTLAKSCRSKRILIHELGHVIGLIHEHQRHDRDKYVKVILENVRNMSQERYQFSKLLSGSITDKTVKYDYTSVMHYGRNYFAKSPELTTLQTTDGRYQDVIGRAERPSFSDIETVNRLYQCSAGCNQYLFCSDHCYMDNSCICRCATAISDKPVVSGPGAYRNSLHDSTCDFFASRGECSGNIKDTVRPLCAKSCGILLMKLGQHQPPNRQHSLGAGQPQGKPTGLNWGHSLDSQGTAVGATLRNNDANTVSDLQISMSGDAMVSVAMQNDMQHQQPSLSGHQSYLQGHQFVQSPNIQSQTKNEELQISQQANARHVDNYLRAALLQKQTSPSSERSHMLRSLILSRTRQSPSEQLNAYLQYGATTKSPDKPNLSDAMSASNWLSQSNMQTGQHFLQQQLLHQQQPRYRPQQQSGPSSQRLMIFNDRQNRINQAQLQRSNFNINSLRTQASMQNRGAQRIDSSNPFADFTGANIGGPHDVNSNGMTQPSNAPDSSRSLQAIGPSFMKSGVVPPDQIPGEPMSPLGSPVEPINVDANRNPTTEQQTASVYFSSIPQQSFEPTFSLTDPVDGQRRATRQSVWDSIIQRLNKQPSTLNSGPTVDTLSQPGTSIDQISTGMASQGSFDSSAHTYTDSNGHMQNQQPWYTQSQSQQPHLPVYHLFNSQLSLTDPNADILAAMSGNASDSLAAVFHSTLSIQQLPTEYTAASQTPYAASDGHYQINANSKMAFANTHFTYSLSPQDSPSLQPINPNLRDARFLRALGSNFTFNGVSTLPFFDFSDHQTRESHSYKNVPFPTTKFDDNIGPSSLWPGNIFHFNNQYQDNAAPSSMVPAANANQNNKQYFSGSSSGNEGLFRF